MSSIGFISIPGGAEWFVIGFIGLLLFGKRLPEVAQSLGKSVTEFKKGLQGIGTETSQPVRLPEPTFERAARDMLPEPAKPQDAPEH